jgi:hypothetical protein
MKGTTQKKSHGKGNSSFAKPTLVHQIVSNLQTVLMPESLTKKTLIINDADKTLCVIADENIPAFITRDLMSDGIYSTNNCCIRVEALRHQNNILVRVSNNGVFVYSRLMHSLGNIAAAAQKLQGGICIQRGEPGKMTVIFSMPSKIAA